MNFSKIPGFGPANVGVAAFVFAALCATQPANAGIIWDYSPDTTGAPVVNGGYENSEVVNHLEQFILGQTTNLTGATTYGNTHGGALVGTQVFVRIYSDVGGAPGVMLDKLTETIDAIDSIGTTTQPSLSGGHVSFSLTLGPSAYWFGMDGVIRGLTDLAGLNNVQDNAMWYAVGDAPVSFTPGIGDMAFRLEGTAVSSVPEPSTLALLGAGLVSLGALRRRRKTA